MALIPYPSLPPSVYKIIMIEFSEDLSKRYSGAEALQRRIEARTKFEKGIVPFTNYGVDYNLFNIDSTAFQSSLSSMLADLNVKYELSGDRLITADIEITLSSLGGSQ